MPGFFEKVKSGAEKAAFEADRLRRVNQAQGVLKGVQRELDAIVADWGPQVLELYDAGTLVQPELLAAGPKIDEIRARLAAQEAEILRIREEKPPEPEPEPAPPPQVVAPPVPQTTPAQPQHMPAPAPAEPVRASTPPVQVKGRFCASCGAALRAGANFCMECGTRVES